MKAKKMIMKNLVIAFIGISTILVNANATAASSDLNKDTGIHVIYTGKELDYSLFKLVVNKSQTNTYLVTIKNDHGTIVFSERLKGDSLSRVYKFPSDFEGGIAGSSIEVKNLGNAEMEVYTISSVSKMVDEVSISKL